MRRDGNMLAAAENKKKSIFAVPTGAHCPLCWLREDFPCQTSGPIWFWLSMCTVR